MDKVLSVVRVTMIICAVIALVLMLAINAYAEEPATTSEEAYAGEIQTDTLQAIHARLEIITAYIESRQEASEEETDYRHNVLECFEAIKQNMQKMETILMYSLAMNAFLLALLVVIIFAVAWGN